MIGKTAIPQQGRLLLQAPNGKGYGVIENRTLKKRVVGTKHFLRKPPAIAIDAELFQRYRAEFDTIEVQDVETGAVYRLSAKHFDYWRWELERGYGKQYAVALSRWKVENPNDPQLRLEV
ncbi:MAG: hypothetical protein KatS3mg021_0070 [Fimbriimonadales bacterium]|nr:MAG: hypothetical protein KatS3mg021_0070 [Fimbriimonadales bacterium]CUU34462.1 hypothetical protein GXSOP10_11645 [Armatimonadetes bacterium GXS]